MWPMGRGRGWGGGDLHAKSHRAALLTISGVAALNKPIAVTVVASGES